MLAEAILDIEVARGMHVDAQVRVPENARGLVAALDGDDALADACNERGFATALLALTADDAHVDNLAAEFAAAVGVLAHDRFLRDRPIGYFARGTGAAAALIAATQHVNDVAAVVSVDGRMDLTGTHLSGVRAPTLLLVSADNDDLLRVNEAGQAALEGASRELCLVSGEEIASSACAWFDMHLRGIMRGQRREVWRQVQ